MPKVLEKIVLTLPISYFDVVSYPFTVEDPFSRPAGGQSAFANDAAWDPFSSSSNQSGFPESSTDAFDPFGTLAIPPVSMMT